MTPSLREDLAVGCLLFGIIVFGVSIPLVVALIAWSLLT